MKKQKDLIVPYRLEGRSERYKNIINKKIRDYIKNGSKGDLNLSHTPIESLPSNLKTVGGDLSLENTKIVTLPDDLTVTGSVFLWGSKFNQIPKNLQIEEVLYLSYTPIIKKYRLLEIKNMIEDRGGKVLDLSTSGGGIDDRYY